MSVVFTLPGKVGDNICKIPIAYQYSKQVNQSVDIILDQNSAGLIDLLQPEEWVNEAYILPGIMHYGLGGQPFDFGQHARLSDWYDEVYHLGYREFPWHNLTESVVKYSNLDEIHKDQLLLESCLNLSVTSPKRLLIEIDSSRDVCNRITAKVLSECVNAGVEIIIAHHQYSPSDPIYAGFKKYNPQFVYTKNMRELAKLMQESLLLTTFSYASCIGYIMKANQIAINAGCTLGHFAPMSSWYEGWSCFDASHTKQIKETLNKYGF